MRLPSFITLYKPRPQSLALEVEQLEARKQRPMSRHRQALIALQKAGPAGMTGPQLGHICPRYSSRFPEDREAGLVIDCHRDGKVFRFFWGLCPVCKEGK